MAQRLNWLGGFTGGNLGHLNYEILTIQSFRAKEIAEETALNKVKWFDYRNIHFLQATYYFGKCYTEAYRGFVRKALDHERAPFFQPFGKPDLMSSKDKGTILKLRQLVDRMGMRYDWFMTFAMSRQFRLMFDGKIYAPRPGHILNNEELIADAMIAWEEQCSISLEVATNPYYRVSNFGGYPDQLAHEAFIVSQIKNRQHKRFALSAALYKHDVLRFEEAVKHFGYELTLEAVKEFESSY